MKKLRVIPSLLATVFVVSNLVAQTAGAPMSNDPSGSDEIVAARSKYLEMAAHAAATQGSPDRSSVAAARPGNADATATWILQGQLSNALDGQ